MDNERQTKERNTQGKKDNVCGHLSIFISIHVLKFDKEETAQSRYKRKKDEGGVFAQNKNKKVKNKDMRSHSDQTQS